MENRKPTDLTAAKKAIKVVVSTGCLGWSTKGTLKGDMCRMLTVAVKLGQPEGEWELADEKEVEYPEADAYLREMDPLVSITMEKVDADVVLNTKKSGY